MMNLKCEEAQKTNALPWSQHQLSTRVMNPIRYVARWMLKFRGIEESFESQVPASWKAILIAHRMAPLFRSKGIPGKFEHWISEDGITAFLYKIGSSTFAFDTYFDDESALVSISTKGRKKRTQYLVLGKDFKKDIERHREHVLKRFSLSERIKALDRSTMKDYLAYDHYWNSFQSSLITPIAFVVQLAIILGALYYFISRL